MTPDQISEMLDLYTDDELPDALRSYADAHLAAHPEAAQEVESLRDTLARLQAVPVERPDSWFVERTLDGLLRENAAQTLVIQSHQQHT